jgi:spore coat polysaccharide biosynthesis protein SpsF (cytidylyltransferase family)
MNGKYRTGILIQARMGSTRLPGKMLMPFLGNLTILDLIIQRLLTRFSRKEIILATTTSAQDDSLECLAVSYGIKAFRGQCDDVLDRFISAADRYGFDALVRVCADNPLMRIDGIMQLLYASERRNCDYISFRMADGTPVIRGHLGLYPELVLTSALRDVASRTAGSADREHVTPYIYSNPSEYKICFLELPTCLKDRTDIRLTVDSASDFQLMSGLCRKLNLFNEDGSLCEEPTIERLIDTIDSTPNAKQDMATEILRNQK